MNQSNILIVDDVPENLRLLSAILKEAGHRVRPVTGGKLALQAAKHSPPDLILLDIKMPELDGLEVCTQLKTMEALKDIPVIFISALHETEDKLKAFQTGGVDYVTKPFHAEEVQARVRTHLELRRQKIQLQENFRQLQKLEKMRDSLTHMIVHDMRSPLMSIDGYLEMLEMFNADSLPADARGFVAQARMNATRLVRLANEMLMVSKLEAGKLPLNLSPCDLATITREMVANHQMVKSRKTIQFIPQPGNFTTLLDRELIGRVLQNLLDNALKFSPENAVVKVSIACANNHIQVEISDQGPGIGADHQHKVFEKFSQVERKSGRTGIGLGLAFCKLVVEAHGGHIGVNSENGQGSTFWFSLKRVDADKSTSGKSGGAKGASK